MVVLFARCLYYTVAMHPFFQIYLCYQVEAGFISTGASICVQGTVLSSQGSKQKIELKVEKIVTVK